MRNRLIALCLCVLFLWLSAPILAEGPRWNGGVMQLLEVYDFSWISEADGFRETLWPAWDGVWVQFSARFTGMEQGRLAPHKVGMTGYWVFPYACGTVGMWGTLDAVRFEYPYPDDPGRLEITLHIRCYPVRLVWG